MASSEDMASSETESEMTLTDESSSLSNEEEESSKEDEPQQHSAPRIPIRRGRGVRTRGGNRCASTPRRTGEWVDWSSAPFTPDIPQFTGTPGPSIAPVVTVSEYVDIFLTEELLEFIVFETNVYARQFLDKNKPTSSSRTNDWKPVVTDDITNYICLTILMGVHSMPSIPDYWSQYLLHRNPVYSAVMSRNRYVKVSFITFLKHYFLCFMLICSCFLNFYSVKLKLVLLAFLDTS